MVFFVVWGFLVWLAATVIFRLAGQWFLIPGDTTFISLAYVLVIPFIFVFTLQLYAYKKLNIVQRIQASICIALPGMLIDSIVLANFPKVFTNLDPQADSIFGSWLLWAYALILLTGIMRPKT